MYFFYNLVLTLGFILLLPRFLFDALRHGKYAAGFWQRFGYLPQFERDGKKIIWLHCVSVGETQAARPLAKEVIANFSDYKLVVSTTTKTGQTLAQDIFKSEAALVFYFPFDWRFVVRRVLRHIQPDAILIMETELWFNFLREAKRQNIRLALVNGRLSEKSFKNYLLIKNFMRRVLSNLDLALMSDEADAKRIIELGCAPEGVFVTGNVKFDLPVERGDELNVLHSNHQKPLIIAASTHEPEERLVLEAFQKLDLPASLIFAPRHPERFERVAELCQKSGLKFVRRSASTSETDVDADLILLDSIGELRSVYPLASLVFVGGSLIPHGGQNILEPAAARKPIVTGFYTMNFAAIVKRFVVENAVVQLPKLNQEEIPNALAEIFTKLLKDKVKRESLSQNAFAVLQANVGATAKTIYLLKNLFKEES